MKGLVFVGTVVLLIQACATDSGVVPAGENMFVITKQAASGFSGMGNLKAETLTEASTFCSKTGKVIKIVDSQESQPPYVFGNFPRIELTFQCVAGN